MGFYTLATGAIPYTDRIRLDEIEAKETGKEFDEQTCGLPIVEIKMFAISKKYQDVFYEYAGFVFCRFGIYSNVSYIKTCIYKL